jgi:hypothetical protein
MTSTRPLSQFATEVRDWIRRSLEAGASPLPFDELALRLFTLQFEHNTPYRRWCEARGATPETVQDWRHIPAVPAASFKELELTSLPPEERVVEFHSSGTTARAGAPVLIGRVDQTIPSPSPRPSPAGRGGNGVSRSPRLDGGLAGARDPAPPLLAGEGRGEGERTNQSEPPPDASTRHLPHLPSRHLHSHESLALYEVSLTAWFQTQVLPDWGATHPQPLPGGEWPSADRALNTIAPRDPSERPSPPGRGQGWVPQAITPGFVHFVALSPSPALAPHSSLVHMFATVQREFGHGPARFFGDVDADGAWMLDLAAIRARLREACAANQPVVLLGTAFSFVHLLDALAEREETFALPAGSRVMETGGYKGRSRELPKAELHRLLSARLGLTAPYIICEYGMSELSSQAYAGWGETPSSRVSPALTWLDGVSPHRIATTSHSSLLTPHFHFPPWARAIVISPETGREVADGSPGLLRVLDFANVWSVMALQTEDLAVRRGDGFELLGRAPTAEPRGCSLMATA